ncbi:MAG: BatA domain-containing protein [Halobacteria archaeon]
MFLNPLGLLGLASLIPLIILYIIRPDPRNLEIPTVQFLPNVDDEGGSNPVIERLRRNLILFLQILALILITLALASPFITVPQSQTVGETVIVLDTSASMATEAGGSNRFQKAISAAKSSVSSSTTIIVSGVTTGVTLNEGDAGEARQKLNQLENSGLTAGEGDLRTAISRASSIADVNSRIVVLSDFADASDWKTSVEVIRNSGTDINLRQFNGGGDSNIGIVGLSFGTQTVTVEVKNYGDSRAKGTVTLGEHEGSYNLNSGGVENNITFPVPAQRSKLRLSPDDSFMMDNVAFLMGHRTEAIDVLMLTSGSNSNLETALDIQDNIRLTKKELPVTDVDEDNFEVVVFSQVPEESSVRNSGTVRDVRNLVKNGGGAVIQAQDPMTPVADYFGNLLLIEPEGMESGTNPRTVTKDRLIKGLSFPPIDRFVRGKLKNGSRALVNSTDNSPLIALSGIGRGRLMYYGFLPGSDFSLDDRYPIFWMRAMNYLSGRQSLSSINRQTGQSWSFPTATEIITPEGSTKASSITLAHEGYYQAGDDTISADLLNPTESNVSAPDIEDQTGVTQSSSTKTSMSKQSVTPIVALIALLIILLELGVMKFRGDI